MSWGQMPPRGGYPSGPKPSGVPPVPEGLCKPRNAIPTQYKQAVYFYGFDWREIVGLRYRDRGVWVHLKDQETGREWKGHLEQPPHVIPMPTIRCADLLANTEDCPTCRGSGKVARSRVSRTVTQK